MARRSLAFLLAMAVLGGALWTPTLHAHTGHAEDHPGAALHAHLEGHHHSAEHTGPSADAADDDRAVYLQAFLAVAPHDLETLPALPPLWELTTLPERPAHRPAEVTHGHDPPPSPARYSRPPPSFLF